MSYQFEGQTFKTLADWKRAFHVYRAYDDLLRAGADTIQKMEMAIAERARRHRQLSIAGSRKSRVTHPHIISNRKRKPCP